MSADFVFADLPYKGLCRREGENLYHDRFYLEDMEAMVGLCGTALKPGITDICPAQHCSLDSGTGHCRRNMKPEILHYDAERVLQKGKTRMSCVLGVFNSFRVNLGCGDVPQPPFKCAEVAACASMLCPSYEYSCVVGRSIWSVGPLRISGDPGHASVMDETDDVDGPGNATRARCGKGVRER